MAVLYVDVSHHDWNRRGGNLGWDKIRAATSGAMIARATYGDPDGWHRSSAHHLDFHRAAKAAGFDLRGSYHNLTRGDSASMARQVDWLRREMDAAGAVWAMADVERYPEMMTAGTFPRWSDVLRFQDRWYAKESRVMAWYLPQWVWSRSDMGSPDLRALRGPLVASRYPLSYTQDDPADLYRRAGGDSGSGWSTYGGKAPELWQYSSSALVPGTTGGADINAFRGTYAGLRTLLTGQTQEEDVTPEDIDTLVERTAEAVWARAWSDYVPNADGTRSPLPASGALFAARRDARDASSSVAALRVEVAGLRATLEQIGAAGSGSVDVSAILARIDAAKEEIMAEQRDAVADFGEGGSAQVRGQQA